MSPIAPLGISLIIFILLIGFALIWTPISPITTKNKDIKKDGLKGQIIKNEINKQLTKQQQKWINNFSFASFCLPAIYSLRAKKYKEFAIILVISVGIAFIGTTGIIIALAIHIFVGVQGKKRAFKKGKESFSEFKKRYNKAKLWFILPAIIAILIPFILGVISYLNYKIN